MNERQTATLIQERRPGAANKAIELQRENPGWSWLKCCSRAKLEWEQKQRTSLPNTPDDRTAPKGETQWRQNAPALVRLNEHLGV